MESSCECSNEPAGKLLSGYTTGGLLSSTQLCIASSVWVRNLVCDDKGGI
jgi:hypothetical protein